MDRLVSFELKFFSLFDIRSDDSPTFVLSENSANHFLIIFLNRHKIFEGHAVFLLYLDQKFSLSK